VNQVSRRPSRARICGLVRVLDPAVPITRALTTRGDTHAVQHLHLLEPPRRPEGGVEPRRRGRHLPAVVGRLGVVMVRHPNQGFASEPTKENSTLSVWPPDVEK
jgi:hypothetical protein